MSSPAPSSSASYPVKKDWVYKLAGAYQTHEMFAYMNPHLHAEAHPTAAHHSVGKMNVTKDTHASSFTVPKYTSGPTSHPKQYEESIASFDTSMTEKPLVSGNEKKKGGLRKLFS